MYTNKFGVSLALNYTGGSILWFLGSVWCLISRQKNMKLREYIHGTENSNEWFGSISFDFIKKLIGLIVFFLVLTGLKMLYLYSF